MTAIKLSEENFAAHFAGGRMSNQPSHAVESHKYGKPADYGAKFKGESMKRDIDEVQNLLDLWADWMAKPEPLTEGYPSEASGGFVTSWRKDSEDADNEARAVTIEKIDAAFDSLQRIYQEAIKRHYGLGHQVWRFGKDATFDDAKTVIRVKFVMKGLL